MFWRCRKEPPVQNSIHPSEPELCLVSRRDPNLSKLLMTTRSRTARPTACSRSRTIWRQIRPFPVKISPVCCRAPGCSWSAYAGGTNLVTAANTNSNTAASGEHLTVAAEPESNWTVPLISFSGSNASYVNPYNGSPQWNFACKHTGSLFFTDTNGSTVTTANNTTSNPEAANYHPLANLASDLANGTTAQFNVIITRTSSMTCIRRCPAGLHLQWHPLHGGDARPGGPGRQLPFHRRPPDHGLASLQEQWRDCDLDGWRPRGRIKTTSITR